ncbi:MAG: hypothetical protein ACM3NJ_00455 [Methanobacterium sp.]
MKNRITVLGLLVVLCCSFLLTGCGQTGKEFVGKWSCVSASDSSDIGQTLTISKNDNSYIIDGKIPATYEDGILTCSMALASVKMFIDEKSGHLMVNAVAWENYNAEFEKIE